MGVLVLYFLRGQIYQLSTINKRRHMKVDTLRPKDSRRTQVNQLMTGIPLKCEIEALRIVKKDQLSFWENKKHEKWNPIENRRYINFLKKNTFLFELQPIVKKKTKINVKMSLAVKSKTPAQCHSHHQKMMLKHGSLEAIIRQNLHFTQEIRLNFKKQTSIEPSQDKIQEPQNSLKMLTDENNYYQNIYEEQWFRYFDSQWSEHQFELFEE